MKQRPSGYVSQAAPHVVPPPAPPVARPSTADLARVLQSVCDEALVATASDTALLWVADDFDVVCIAAAGQGRSLVGWRLPRERALARICFESKAPLLIEDVLGDSRADLEVWGNLGARSFACVPVLVRSLVAATLEVHGSKSGPYSPRALESLIALSHRATSAFRRSIRESGPQRRPRLSELPGAVAYQERLSTIRTEYGQAALMVVVVGPPLEAASLHLVRDVLMGSRASDDPFVVDAAAFAVIMPDTPREGARIAAKRIGGILRERGLAKVGLGTADIGDDPFTSHDEALTEARTDLNRPPPPVF